jgi:hypothetical protein
MKTLSLNRRSKVLIGVVHLKPLPGSPGWESNLEVVLKSAVRDALAYQRGGADAVFIENFGDIPFTKGSVGPETLTSMAVVGSAVRSAIDLPMGFNVLRNDACAALALCAACGGSFIRVNVHTGAMLTDQGIIEGKAYETVRYRRHIAPGTRIFADIHVKHAVPLGAWTLEDSARDAIDRGGVEGLIVSGRGTGLQPAVEDVKTVAHAAGGTPVFVGSGVTESNIRDYLPYAQGFIVGSSLKQNGGIHQPVDARKVGKLAKLVANRA